MKTNDIAAIQWVLQQPGLKMIVGKDETVSLIYGHSFEVHDTPLAEAVEILQDAQRAKDNITATSCTTCVP